MIMSVFHKPEDDPIVNMYLKKRLGEGGVKIVDKGVGNRVYVHDAEEKKDDKPKE